MKKKYIGFSIMTKTVSFDLEIEFRNQFQKMSKITLSHIFLSILFNNSMKTILVFKN